MVWELAVAGRKLLSSQQGPSQRGMRNEGQFPEEVRMGTGV